MSVWALMVAAALFFLYDVLRLTTFRFPFLSLAPSEPGVFGAARAPHGAVRHVQSVPGGAHQRADSADAVSGGRRRAVSRRGGPFAARATRTSERAHKAAHLCFIFIFSLQIYKRILCIVYPCTRTGSVFFLLPWAFHRFPLFDQVLSHPCRFVGFLECLFCDMKLLHVSPAPPAQSPIENATFSAPLL